MNNKKYVTISKKCITILLDKFYKFLLILPLFDRKNIVIVQFYSRYFDISLKAHYLRKGKYIIAYNMHI